MVCEVFPIRKNLIRNIVTVPHGLHGHLVIIDTSILTLGKLGCTAHDCANMFSGPTGSCVRDGRPWASSRCQTILSCTKFLILRIKN